MTVNIATALPARTRNPRKPQNTEHRGHTRVDRSSASKAIPSLCFRASEIALNPTRESFIHDGVTTLDTPRPRDIPSAESFAAVIAQQAIEALLGRRPVRQLQAWFTPALYQSFVRRTALCTAGIDTHTARYPTRIRRVKCSFPRNRVAEAAVIVHDGERLRAVAIRLEVRHRHWQVAALEIA